MQVDMNAVLKYPKSRHVGFVLAYKSSAKNLKSCKLTLEIAQLMTAFSKMNIMHIKVINGWTFCQSIYHTQISWLLR